MSKWCVERRDLVHLGHRELHLGGERDEVRGAQAPEAVLERCRCSIRRSGAARRIAEVRATSAGAADRPGGPSDAARRRGAAEARDVDDGGGLHRGQRCGTGAAGARRAGAARRMAAC
jgi:hypothetical protein